MDKTRLQNYLKKMNKIVLQSISRNMGKKGFNKGPNATSGSQMSVTLREASTGKKHTNTKSSLKLQHIKNLAMWASQDAGIPSLGAFFGHHLAASSESIGAPVDPSLFTCQRCMHTHKLSHIIILYVG